MVEDGGLHRNTSRTMLFTSRDDLEERIEQRSYIVGQSPQFQVVLDSSVLVPCNSISSVSSPYRFSQRRLPSYFLPNNHQNNITMSSLTSARYGKVQYLSQSDPHLQHPSILPRAPLTHPPGQCPPPQSRPRPKDRHPNLHRNDRLRPPRRRHRNLLHQG
jgi:hypothetical protein